jgi:SAM-dependent methyltransferase
MKPVASNCSTRPQQSASPGGARSTGVELHPAIYHIASQLPNAQTYIGDALFGYKCIQPYLENLTAGAVLEVGSGPCILLSQIKTRYPALRLFGIEPIGSGFEKSRESAELLKESYQLSLFEGGYEEFDSPEQFDLIFLINVFEHLPNWRHFLGFVEQKLKRDGKCVILCSNGGFPYEPHFAVPIIWNKPLTYFFFKQRIARREARDRSHGLWDSLNLVSLREVWNELKSSDLELSCHNHIMEELIARIGYDRQFSQRQRLLGVVARGLAQMGVTQLFRLGPLRFVQPYLFLELRRRTAHPGAASAHPG